MTSNRPLKGMKNVRSMRSIVASSTGPSDEQSSYLAMHRLMTERKRLARELEMWEANVQRIKERLTDIDNQMEQLRSAVAKTAAEQGKQGGDWEEFTLLY